MHSFLPFLYSNPLHYFQTSSTVKPLAICPEITLLPLVSIFFFLCRVLHCVWLVISVGSLHAYASTFDYWKMFSHFDTKCLTYFQCHAGKKAEASEAEPMDEASSAAAAANEWTTTVLVLPQAASVVCVQCTSLPFNEFHLWGIKMITQLCNKNFHLRIGVKAYIPW